MKKLFILLLVTLLASTNLFAIQQPLATAEPVNLISNPSVETVSPTDVNLPQNWNKNKWRINTSTFTYKKTEGHTGSKSLYISTTSFTIGDAKWVFDHVNVKPSTSYTYSDFSKSNVTTSLMAEYKNTTNVVMSYVSLGAVTANANWGENKISFTTPANAKSITIFHLLDKVGWLHTDDFSLTENSVAAPTPPTVNFTSPTVNATVSGSQTVSANASDPVRVAGVQFKVDGANIGIEDVTAPYSVNWDTTTTVNGTHSLTATVRNTNNLTSTSTISVNVQNTTTPPPPVSNNLVPNPSAETVDPANGQKPQSWLNGNWGSNTPLYTYVSSGHTGSKSLKTEITNYSSGDAKWYFEPISVQAGKTYEYSHYYQSSVTTDVVAQYTDANGVNTYKWLNTLAPSATWQEFGAGLVAPAGATKLTILHILYSVGWVQMDDASLIATVPPAPDTGTVPNSSLEQASGGSPVKWNKSSWGTNTAVYEYMGEGHTGTKSVKVTVSNYTSGDAKWYFEPITTLEKGKQYRFNAWYKTNTSPEVVAMFTRANGTTQYFGMPDPFPSASSATVWQQYSDTFTVPVDAVSVSVFMFVNKNGWVQTDDYNIVPYQPTGFNRPLVSLTFDDGHEDNITNALPLLNQYGFKSTQCYAVQHLEDGDPNKAQNIQSVIAFHNAGHETCSHTVSHPFLTSVSSAQLSYELEHSKQVLESIIGQPVLNFASPYGDYNEHVNSVIDNYYQSHRTVDEGYNSKDNLNLYRLRVQNMQNTTTLAELQSWLDQAKATNTWLILVYHRVASDAGQFDTYPNDFAAQLQAIKSSGITVKTYQGALVEVRAQ